MDSRLKGNIDDFIFIESPKILTLKKAERGTHIKLVTVHGKTKTFQRKQRVGKKDVETKPKIDKDKKAEWENWQQYYRDELFRPSASPHEDYYSQSILMATSAQHAKSLIRRFQAKDPSSMGIDLATDFERLYNQTKDKVPKRVEEGDNKTLVNQYLAGMEHASRHITKSSLHPDNLKEINDLNESGIVGLVGGIHEEETFICKFKDGSSAIHKTMMKGDIVGEVGSYEISKILGWNIVPETIQCNYGKGEGSCQKWIPNTKEPMGKYNKEYTDYGIQLEEKHFDDLSKIFIMDMINGNFDRHSGNIIIDKNDKCWAIDNEMIGKLNNAQLHIESLNEWAKSGEGSFTPMISVLQNSFGNDKSKYKNFKDHVDKNINQVIQNKDEIIKYWSQYKDSTFLNTSIPLKESIKYIQRNIEYLEYYQNMEMNII